MAGKARPSLRKKTLENVMLSNLSKTDKDCIKAVFEEADSIVRCKDCPFRHPPREFGDLHCGILGVPMKEDDFCSYGERKED